MSSTPRIFTRGWRKSWERRLRFHALLALLGLIARLPRRVGQALLGGIGALLVPWLKRARRPVLANLRLVFPEWTERERQRFLRRVGRSLGRNGFDFLRISRSSLADIERLVAIEGLEHMRAAHAKGRGVVCVSAHLGCWELLPLRFRALGFPVAVVYRPLRDPRMDRYVAARRARFGVVALDRDDDARGMLRSLRAGSLLGILPDQDTRVDSIVVPFLGHPARSPVGPVRLAMRSGAPMVPVVIRMRSDGTHGIRVGPEILLTRPGKGAPAEEVDAAIAAGTERWAAAIGEMILEAPDQWVWFHDRWRELEPDADRVQNAPVREPANRGKRSR
ncbi:MAG: lysophospholipid acyltransferase family protein [Candidatus Eisenbacteria bacterium]|nr:lysophospholipid acyltransferase family protein [Candidatus Eisenbacteria bacterium]